MDLLVTANLSSNVVLVVKKKSSKKKTFKNCPKFFSLITVCKIPKSKLDLESFLKSFFVKLNQCLIKEQN